MPDVVGLVLLLAVGGVVAAFVAAPLVRGVPDRVIVDHETLVVRHRLALEALRDVEVDRRAGSLDDEAYGEQRTEAEARAVATLRALEAAHRSAAPIAADRPLSGLAAVLAGLGLGALLVIGFLAPPPLTLANQTVVNEALAEGLAREEARQAEIERLEASVAADPRDAEALSALADAYLAGEGREDLVRAAVVLLLLVDVEPENVSAYERLITAYIRAGDHDNAAAATERLAEIEPASPNVAFFRGLIAHRTGAAETAVTEFDRFLELAPDDPRAPMVRSLRAEAAGELPAP